MDMRQDFDAQAAELEELQARFEVEREVFKKSMLKAKKKARGQDRVNQILREALGEIKVSTKQISTLM